MISLLLAVISSAMVSVIMRLSSGKVSGNMGMLAVNYLMCLVVAGAYAGPEGFVSGGSGAFAVVLMGIINGFFYLAGFMLLQSSVAKNGVVLSSLFMKLGLLVPIAVSVTVFGDYDEYMHWARAELSHGKVIHLAEEWRKENTKKLK